MQAQGLGLLLRDRLAQEVHVAVGLADGASQAVRALGHGDQVGPSEYTARGRGWQGVGAGKAWEGEAPAEPAPEIVSRPDARPGRNPPPSAGPRSGN